MTIYDEMWEMMRHYQFDIDRQLSSHFTCIICNKLLIDAYHGLCGCKYCKGCLDKFMQDGGKVCPGNTNDCIVEKLSGPNSIVIDKGANRTISKLKVKCPFDLCDCQCELIDMCHHLKLCDKRETLCPFGKMGCTEMITRNDKVAEHLVSDIPNHNKLMVEWISNVRIEMECLMSDRERGGLINLEESINTKITQAMMNYVNDRRMKEVELEKLHREMVDKNETLMTHVTRQIKDIEELQQEKDKQSKEIFLLKVELKSLREIIEEASVIKVDVEELTGLEDAIKHMESKETTQNMLPLMPQEHLKTVASLVWSVDKISNMFNGSISSSRFLSIDQNYEMNLVWLYSPRNYTIRITFNIDLTSPKKDKHTTSLWPCQCSVTIAIINKVNPMTRQVMSENVELNHKKRSIFFDFSLFDLDKAKVLESKLIVIQCDVSIESC